MGNLMFKCAKHADSTNKQGPADQENSKENDVKSERNSRHLTSGGQEDKYDQSSNTNKPAKPASKPNKKCKAEGNHEDKAVIDVAESGDHIAETNSQSQKRMTKTEPASFVPEVRTEKGKNKKVIKQDREQNEQITENVPTKKIITDVDLQKENNDLRKQNKSLHEEIQKLRDERCELQKKQSDNLTQALDREKKEKEQIKRNFEEEMKRLVTNYDQEIMELEKIISQNQENWSKPKHIKREKDVRRKAQNVNPRPMPDLQQKNKVCVASSNKGYMAAVAQNVEELLQPFFPPIALVVFQKKITSTINATDGFYEGATLVVLVATASQRMLLISNKEDSQVGKAYQQAENEKVSVFLVVAGHNDSDGLPDTVPYANSLTQVFSSQPKVRMLAKRGKLISAAYTYNPTELKFNTEQSKLITAWLQRKLESTRM